MNYRSLSKHKQWKSVLPLADQMLVSASHFLVQILLARSFGLEEYGVFTALWLVLIFISSFHQSFIIAPMMTIGPQHENSRNYFSSLTQIQFYTSILLLACGLLLAHLVSRLNFFDAREELLLLPFMIVGFICHDYFRKLFYTRKEVESALIYDIAVYGFQLVSLLFLYFSGKLTMLLAIVAIAVSYLIGTIVLFYRKLKSIEVKAVKDTFDKHWSFSKWLVAKSGLQWLSGNLFLIAAGSILGAAALGAVRMAQNVIGILNILFLSIENTVPVKAADILKLKGKQKLNTFFDKLSMKSGIAVLVLLIFIAVFSSPLLHLIYGEVSVETIWVLRAFCFLYMIVFLSTLKRLHIRTLEENKQIFVAYFLSAIFSVLAAYPMIKNWGLSGVMIGFIVTQLISLVYYSIFLNKNQLNI